MGQHKPILLFTSCKIQEAPAAAQPVNVCAEGLRPITGHSGRKGSPEQGQQEEGWFLTFLFRGEWQVLFLMFFFWS